MTISNIRLTSKTVTWCEHCSYPNTRLTFTLSGKADLRLELIANLHGHFKQVAATILHAHAGHNSFRVAGRWRGQLVPHRTVRVLVGIKPSRGQPWKTIKTLELTVRSPFTTG